MNKGYVALFKEPLSRQQIVACVEIWLSRFERVEQVATSGGAGTLAYTVEKTEDVIWSKDLQFRITADQEFTWVYLTQGSWVVETTGFAHAQISLCLDVLIDLPSVIEIIDENNDKRLDELEAQGKM